MIKIDTTVFSKMILEKHKKSPKKLAIAYYIALRDIGDKNVKDIKNNIKPNGGKGKIYRKKIRGNIVVKQASSEDQYPISWTGALKARTNSKNTTQKVTIFNIAKHAYCLENKDKSKGGRPFMINTITKNENETRNIVFKRVGKALERL